MCAENVAKIICDLVWSFPLLIALFGVGVYFSFKLNFVQIRRIKEAFGYILKSKKSQENSSLLGDISNFASLCTALSATLGTGNIVGIAVAVSVGGAGTLFWLIVSSFFSLATKYCEGLLAIKYRVVRSDNKMAGGPMYYIEKGFGSKILAKMFAIFGAGVALIGIGTLAQTNSITAAATSFGIPTYVTSIVLATVVAMVTFGGIHRIAEIAEKVIPVMSIFYIGAAIIILILKIDAIPHALYLIVHEAFAPQAMLGGGIGAGIIQAIQVGMRRGIFCHEAGLGSSAIASAAAKVKNPTEQGLICMVGAFLSIVICLITGLVLVTTAEDTQMLSQTCAIPETLLTAHAFGAGLYSPWLGKCIVNISILFFAFTTIIGWNYYGEKCVQYVFDTSAITPYRLLFMFFVVVGPFLNIKTAFIVADIIIGLMAIPNIIALIALRKEIIEETESKYVRKRKNGQRFI